MVELTLTSMAHGGAAVGRIDGKTHFVEGGIPGERVRGDIVVDKKTWARVELHEVLDGSSERITPPCQHFAACGGCQWQFVDHATQLGWKQSILVDQLVHIGGIETPPVVEPVSPGQPFAYRNRMDFSVVDGHLALSTRRSHTLVPISECLLLAPELSSAFERIKDVSGARSVTLRSSATTGKVLAVIRGKVPDTAATWGIDVSRRDRTGVKAVIGDGLLHETVAEASLRITGDAFFQNNTAGAATLIELVTAALDPRPDDTMLDGYAGGGLFSATIGARVDHVIAVEVNGLAVHDLTHNLATAGVDHEIIKTRFEELEHAGPWDVAVVDPPREGLGRRGVVTLTRGGPRTIAYVSCDPASLARDAKLLAGSGYLLEQAIPVDLFPQTFHIETVARFVRS